MLAILTFSTIPSLTMVDARIDWDLTASSEVLRRSSVVSALGCLSLFKLA